VSRAAGISDRKLLELARYQTSDAYDDDERLALDLAVAMTATPAAVSDELRDALRRRFTKGQIAELVSAIAWENHRARMNRALDVREMGFSDGAMCAQPEHAAGRAPPAVEDMR
jgi:alkylhydroperoxidase family enzyme